MNLQALDMPDEPTPLALWLEQRLAGPDLPTLAEELSAFREAPAGAAPPAVRDLLGEWQEPVLAGGLKLAPPDVVRRLLTWPERLPDLQELVYMRGGRYWDRLLGSDGAARDVIDHSRQRLSAVLPAPAPDGEPGAAPAVLPLKPRPVRRRVGWVVGLAAAAAAVVLAVVVSRHFPPAVPPAPSAPAAFAWGWNRPGVVDSDGSAPAYLDRLADAADEWFADRPEGATATAERLNDYRRGCSLLLLAAHEPLAPADRQWLKDKCRKWAAKIDQELAEVEAGDAAKGRDDADAMTHQLVTALRKKAQELAAG